MLKLSDCCELWRSNSITTSSQVFININVYFNSRNYCLYICSCRLIVWQRIYDGIQVAVDKSGFFVNSCWGGTLILDLIDFLFFDLIIWVQTNWNFTWIKLCGARLILKGLSFVTPDPFFGDFFFLRCFTHRYVWQVQNRMTISSLISLDLGVWTSQYVTRSHKRSLKSLGPIHTSCRQKVSGLQSLCHQLDCPTSI